MKNYVLNWALAVMAILFVSCQEEEPTLETILPPTNMVVSIDLVGADADNPYGDGSGFVDVTITADNAVSYQVAFNGDLRPAPGGKASFTSDFTTVGVNQYTFTAIAIGAGGVANSSFQEVEVFYDYRAPDELLEKLYGTSGSKTWRIKAEKGGHFGLGPVGGVVPSEWYGASPEEKVGTGMYDDRYVFNEDGTFTHITNVDTTDGTGTVFGREVLIEELNGAIPDLVTQGADVLNYPFNDYTVNYSITAPGGVETINLSGTGFFGYYIGGNHSYQIFDRSVANELLLRTTDGNAEFDWWFILTSEEPGETTTNTLETQFANLVWADEFDADGTPNEANWTYDLGDGGWGNQESQIYTRNADNVAVNNGYLNITAKKVIGGGTFYFDDLAQTDAAGNVQNIIEDFEGTAPTFGNFGGSTSQTIINPDASGINTTANVGEMVKADGAEIWAGSSFDLAAGLDMTVHKNFTLKTWSPKEGVTVRFKIENSANSAEFYEGDAITTVSNAWETLTFDFSEAANFTYDRMVVFFDFGLVGGSTNYTSARVKSEGLQQFTFGRIEIRAKLPSGGGTWPALWMLGADYLTNPWPACGEMDIMEHVGNNQDVILGTTHHTGFSGGNGRTGSIIEEGVSQEFHIYEMEWNANEIIWAIDGKIFHTVSNDATMPFNKDFFFIMNVAMGGTLGGEIDSAFESSMMQVDYVRMYQ